MRILGFNQMWPKLRQDTFTTFRFPRRDADWQVGELVQVVIKPRQKGGGEKLGIAEIIGKERRWARYTASNDDIPLVSTEEAQADGFSSKNGMVRWLQLFGHPKTAERIFTEPMYKLTLRWLERR